MAAATSPSSSVELCTAAALVLALHARSSYAAEVCWDDEGSRYCSDGYVCCEYSRCCRIFSTPFIVGIVCGCAAVVILIVSLCCYFYIRRRRRRQRQVPALFIIQRPFGTNQTYGSTVDVNGQLQHNVQLQSQLLTYLTPHQTDLTSPHQRN